MAQHRGIEKGLVGFLLAHGQFRLPDLVELGAAGSAAGIPFARGQRSFVAVAGESGSFGIGLDYGGRRGVAREWRMDGNDRHLPDAALQSRDCR